MESIQYVGEICLHGNIEAGHRLVQNQYLGPHGQHPGDADTLFLTVTQIMDQFVGAICHPHRQQSLFHPPSDCFVVQSEVQRTKRNILPNACGKQLTVGILKDQTHH